MNPTAHDGRRKVEGVLLDADGTLIDSNDAHADFGRNVPSEKIRPQMR